MIYIIDSSSFICLSEKYPESVFETLYRNFNNAMNNDILKAPYQVFNEIKKQDDSLYKWLKNYKNKFVINMDEYIINTAFNIIYKFPQLTKNEGLENTDDDPADPYVIATAIRFNEGINREPVKIITEEGF